MQTRGLTERIGTPATRSPNEWRRVAIFRRSAIPWLDTLYEAFSRTSYFAVQATARSGPDNNQNIDFFIILIFISFLLRNNVKFFLYQGHMGSVVGSKKSSLFQAFFFLFLYLKISSHLLIIIYILNDEFVWMECSFSFRLTLYVYKKM